MAAASSATRPGSRATPTTSDFMKKLALLSTTVTACHAMKNNAPVALPNRSVTITVTTL